MFFLFLFRLVCRSFVGRVRHKYKQIRVEKKIIWLKKLIEPRWLAFLLLFVFTRFCLLLTIKCAWINVIRDFTMLFWNEVDQLKLSLVNLNKIEVDKFTFDKWLIFVKEPSYVLVLSALFAVINQIYLYLSVELAWQSSPCLNYKSLLEVLLVLEVLTRGFLNS